MLFIFVISGVVAVSAVFYFFKTSTEMPKTWYEWKTELRFQYIGALGLVQDHFFRHKNKVALYKQPGRIAVITGGNRGIGLRIIEKLLECEMTVIMGCRNPKCAEKSVGEVIDLSNTKGKLIIEELDVGSLSSVRAFGKKLQENYEKLDILVNNAGIMFAPYKLTEDGFESHLATNHLGHFLLTHMLLNQLRKGGTEDKNARIVNVSSLVHMVGKINYSDINLKKHYYPATGYHQSKLAQILFTRYLNKILLEEGSHVQVHAVHPGVVDTDLFNNTKVEKLPFFKKVFFKTPEEGSRTVVFAAIDPSIENQGGTYLSDCVPSKMHADAKNYDKCKKLFDFSCDLVKVEHFGDGKV